MKKTVVLDWDGTLAISLSMMFSPEGRRRKFPQELGKPIELSISRDGANGEYALFLRPGLKNFLSTLEQKYHIVLWSFGVQKYIDECLHKAALTKYFHPGLVITREKMAAMHTDLKDLHALRKVSPLHETLIVDDSNEMFGILNPFNCIDAPTYSLNTADHFLDVLPLLIDFHFQNVLSRHTEEQLLALRKDIIQALTSRTPKFAYD